MKKIYILLTVIAMFLAATPSQKAYAGCSLPGGFWIDHQDMWPEGFTPDRELCEMTFSEILQTPSKGRPWHVLAHQWIVAQLNVANGAHPGSLGTALEDAEALLNKADFSRKPKHLYAYLALAGILADHNNGLLSRCKRCPHDITVVCPPCPACCCPECPACPACECGDVVCNCPEPPECSCGDNVCICPEPAECVCNCEPQIACPRVSSSTSSCSASRHHRHHHKHCNASRNIPTAAVKSAQPAVRAKKPSAPKKAVLAKEPVRNKKAVHAKNLEHVRKQVRKLLEKKKAAQRKLQIKKSAAHKKAANKVSLNH